MKKIRITSDCLVNGQHAPAKTELNLDIVTAQQLLDAGVAVEIKPGKEVNKTAVETREPETQDRDPKPAKEPAKKQAKEAPAAE